MNKNANLEGRARKMDPKDEGRGGEERRGEKEEETDANGEYLAGLGVRITQRVQTVLWFTYAIKYFSFVAVKQGGNHRCPH